MKYESTEMLRKHRKAGDAVYGIPADAYVSTPRESWILLHPSKGRLESDYFLQRKDRNDAPTWFLPNVLPQEDCPADTKYHVSSMRFADTYAEALEMLKEQADREIRRLRYRLSLLTDISGQLDRERLQISDEERKDKA